MRKTKIVCTVGPATDREGVLRKMMLAGMDVARFNFSHGTYEEHLRRLNELRTLREELNLPVAAMLDTKGPEIRLKDFVQGKVTLRTGQEFTLITGGPLAGQPGTEEYCAITYPGLAGDVSAGSTILIDDGLVRLTVLSVTPEEIRCRVENDGDVSNHKGINAPGSNLTMPFLSAQDRSDIQFGIDNGFDIISASFVRSAQDVRDIRNMLRASDSDMQIIAKLENQTGIDNLHEILSVADGIMVARGDMGVEVNFTEIPAIQKTMIAACVRTGKPVITATQMLDSMMENPRPTRAEITDVANAIYDGTSAIMLSGETAAGKYPVEAVQTMDAIARRTEEDIRMNTQDRNTLKFTKSRFSITEATAHAACTTAADIAADAILTVSNRGNTARMVSAFRPETRIIALLLDEQVRRQMNLYRGVTPLRMTLAKDSDELVDSAVSTALSQGVIKQGDVVVVTAGVPVGISGTTNMIRITQVGGVLVSGVGIGSQKITGTIRLCDSTEDLAEKRSSGDIKPDDILVVHYTCNEMMPCLKDAAGIICVESGVDSHAATIGTLLEKPVIIGAAAAFQVLHDGMKVILDCERGIVQALPE